MKKLVKTLLIISLALATFVLSSCSQPNGSSGGIESYLNGNNINANTLFGTWKSIYIENAESNSIKFSSPDKYEFIFQNSYANFEGTFSVYDDKLILNRPDASPSQVTTKIIIKNNKLYLFKDYISDDEIRIAYKQYGSFYNTVEEFLIQACNAIYVKQ